MAKKDRFQEGCDADVGPTLGRPYAMLRESEDSGSSGQVDVEIPASEGSCGPLRKCSRLSVDARDTFGVPTQVLRISNISRTEKKELAHRLRLELDQVRILQKRVDLQRTTGATISSSSDVINCSDGNNPPAVADVRTMQKLIPEPAKNSDSAGHRAGGWHRGSSGKFESGNKALSSSTKNTIIVKQCQNLLEKLMSHQYGWVFNTPVDVKKLNIPDYFDVIKHPMDLGTIKKKMASGLYSNPLDFVADVKLTFSNAMTYNPPTNDVHIMAGSLCTFFEARWKAIEKKIVTHNRQSLPPKSCISEERRAGQPQSVPKKRKANAMQHQEMPERVERIMTDREKHNLGKDLQALAGDMPMQIVDFLRGHSSIGKETIEDEEEIEIDIDKLRDETLFTLRKLLDEYLQTKQIAKAKDDPCEIELLNKSGLSSSSMQLSKVDPVNECSDVGGSDPPISSCFGVEISTDTVLRSNTNLNMSNSETDGAKASRPGNEKMVSESDADRKATPGLCGNNCASNLDQPDLKAQPNPSSGDSKGQQDEESNQSEKPLSPTKLYRAALLKSRFADTILKAREKTLKQGEEGDPERLRREKEELELEKKKEKARLLAEAKAAEDARRRADAEAAAKAAAEARKKRELEREAAREALQKMERTVIHENGGFLEDLERLGAAPPEVLLSSVDETSPEHSQEALGSFNFRGANPLEQLGLYMKMDEDEEEGEPPSSLNTVDDMEEGEID